jgi:hypothetical protein
LRRLGLAVACILLCVGGLSADIETSVDVTALASVTRDAAGTIIPGFIGKGDLSFSAVANANVKAGCELAGVWSGTLITPPADLLKRLFIKVDFGGVYLLAGKARVTWGEGFVFNAGDVVFGSLAPVADLSQALLRDQTDWLVDLSVPLGPFTYIEGIVLPYSPLEAASFPATTVSDLRGGGRFVTDLGGLKIEAGYLFKADEVVHHPYLSLQGNLFFDLNLSASWKIPAVNSTDDRLKQGLAVTAGLFRLVQIEGDMTLSLRLEAVCRPFGLWAKPSVPAPTDIYGLLVYPEVSLSPSDVLSFGLRAMVNPIDFSGLATANVTFAIYQGLTIIGSVWVMWGDGGDPVFGFGRAGDLGVSAGLNFIY